MNTRSVRCRAPAGGTSSICNPDYIAQHLEQASRRVPTCKTPVARHRTFASRCARSARRHRCIGRGRAHSGTVLRVIPRRACFCLWVGLSCAHNLGDNQCRRESKGKCGLCLVPNTHMVMMTAEAQFPVIQYICASSPLRRHRPRFRMTTLKAP